MLEHEPDLRWQSVVTEHFSVHYPEGFEDLGRRVATLCEQLYEPVSRSLNWFPGRTDVVVHTRADFPGGVVTFLPWRMELFITEPQSNVAGSGDSWLRVVIAHELTHIVHLRKHRGLSTITQPLLGEFNAFWHHIVPQWFTEGFATLNESRHTNGGAARVPYTWMQMAAPVYAGQPWPLENTGHDTRTRMPRQRMPYVSGYFLTERVEREYGPGTWAKILDRYSAFPLKGFSRTVKSVTGKPLRALYLQVLDDFSPSRQQQPPVPVARVWRPISQPENQNSPRWLNMDEIMVYRKSFDDLDELAILDRSGRLEPLLIRSLTKSENGYSLGKNLVVWAELHPHPRFSATIYSDLKTYDLNTHSIRNLTRDARLYCPDLSPDESQVVAVQTDLPTARLVTVNVETGHITAVFEAPGATPMNPRWSPQGDRLAFSIRDSTGYQDIAVLDLATRHWQYLYIPDTYHDNNPSWTPDGRFVLYTSDRSGVFNIWAVRVSTGERWQVTQDPLGAFTPDVSPDGRELAFASYSHLGFRASSTSLDTSRWIGLSHVLLPPSRDPIPDKHAERSPVTRETDWPALKLAGWPGRTYRPWRYLVAPQGWVPYPIWDPSAGGFWLALFAASADPLHRHAWNANLGHPISGSRYFADVRYTYRRWWPAVSFRGYSYPREVSTNGESGRWQKIGAELTASVPLVWESNVYTTFIHPFFRWRTYEWKRTSGPLYPSLSEYQGPQAGFTAARVSQTPRDVVFLRALILTAYADWTGPWAGSDFSGRQFTATAQLFSPTLVPHHQLEILLKYQHRTGTANWTYSGTLPVGYADDGKPSQTGFKVAYHLPLAYLEWPVPLIPVWVDYLDGAVFFDWGTSWEKESKPGLSDLSGPYSAGFQITSIQYALERLRVRLGFALYYHSQMKEWRAAPVVELPF